MRAFMAIVKREFLAYFFSPLAYVVLTGFLFASGWIFYQIVVALNVPDTPRAATMTLFFTNAFYWIFMMLFCSMIAMRLIAEERKSGSIEALLTAPVSETTVVAAKFLGAWCFLMFLWLPTVLYPIMLSRFGAIDFGPVAAGYLGIGMVGALFLSAGTFASTLSKNQIVSAVIGFVLILAVFIIGFSENLGTSPAWRDALSYLNLAEQMDEFSRGIIDTRRLVYVFSTVVFFLFLSTKSLEANKGK